VHVGPQSRPRDEKRTLLKLFTSSFCVSIERRSCGARRDSGDRVFEIKPA
jgi:hypothetical protein